MEHKTKRQVKIVKKQEQKKFNKLFLFLCFASLGALFVSFMVPVYYVPLFNSISARYGLSVDIARRLTLLDLALDSLGVETPNMASAFKQQKIDYQPEIFITSRFNTDGASHLINVKETYYHEYERTHKRPAEVAGIYKDKTAVNTPEIDGDLSGVRALPKGDFLTTDDDGFTDFSYKKATATTSNKEEVMGSKRRQVRGSFDRQDQGVVVNGGRSSNKKPEPLPDFVSSIYNPTGRGEEVQTLENSRMIKPVVSGEPFSVVKPEGVISKLVGDSSFTDTFSVLRNFGGNIGGSLGYYVKDDLPKFGTIDFMGISGRDVFKSYFYSHAAVSRRYGESSKHLSEVAFHGDEPKDELLLTKDQVYKRSPAVNAGIPPLLLMLTVKRNIKGCEAGHDRYLHIIRPLVVQYSNKIEDLKNISLSTDNVAKAGAPGSCNEFSILFGLPLGRPTAELRRDWNNLVDELTAQCKLIRDAGIEYANSCKMNYITDPLKDTCEQIDVLKVRGGTEWGNVFEDDICRRYIIWEHPDGSNSFKGCGGSDMWDNQGEDAARRDCADKIDNLFKEIDMNIQLEAQPGFIFN